MKILVLLNRFEGYNFHHDTSHLLMYESYQRGHEVFYGTFDGLSYLGVPQVSCQPVQVRLTAPYFEFGAEISLALTDFQAILIRPDPPVDAAYHYAMQLLSLLPAHQVMLNPPAVLRDFNEKLIILQFPQWIPKTLVSSRIEEIRNFHTKVGNKIILKPLNGFAGQGVQVYGPGESPLLPASLPIMAQEFLPAIHAGEKRLFFLEDRVLAVLLKIPLPGKFLANPDQGAKLATCTLTDREQRIATDLGVFFKKQGIFLAGVDLIGEHLTEINITSPGLLWELNEAYQAHFEQDIMDALHRRCQNPT